MTGETALATIFEDMVLSEMEGTPAARDVPDIVTSVATDYILCSESDIRRDWQYTRSFDFATSIWPQGRLT